MLYTAASIQRIISSISNLTFNFATFLAPFFGNLDGQARESIRFFLPRDLLSPPNKRSDLFALGSTMYYIISEHEPYHTLPDEEGTCSVRVTLDGNREARTLVDTEVLVTRKPCLHPGDLRKFEVVDIPHFSHLVDFIVFPTCGSRPSADLMSGGELDGDKCKCQRFQK